MTMLFHALAFATGVSACARDFTTPKRHTHRQPITKRNTEFPPVLTDRETLLANAFDNVTIDEWSYYYGHQNKLAGLGHEAAQWTADRWSENGFQSRLEEYHVYLSYPVSQSLSVTYADGRTADINLVEPAAEGDDVTAWENNQPTFHGYSASGNVSGEYFYVGYVLCRELCHPLADWPLGKAPRMTLSASRSSASRWRARLLWPGTADPSVVSRSRMPRIMEPLAP